MADCNREQNSVDNEIVQPVPDMPENENVGASIYDEILDSLYKPKPRKRSSPNICDIAHRFESKKARIEEQPEEKITECPDLEIDQNISPLDNNANGIETVTKDLVDNLEEPSFNLAPIRKNAKKSVIKTPKALVIDRVTMLSSNVIKSNTEHYKEKLTVKSPMETWIMRLYQTKCSDGSYFNSPGSRLKGAAKKLMPCFERNLKKLSINTLKRSLDVHDQCIPKSSKKQKVQHDKKAGEESNLEFLNALDLQPVEETNLMPIEEMNPLPIEEMNPLPTESSFIPDVEAEQPQVTKKPFWEKRKKITSEQNQEYNEKLVFLKKTDELFLIMHFLITVKNGQRLRLCQV